MAFRSEACVILAAVLSAATLAAQTAELRHGHLYKSGPGKLTVSEQGIVWEEGGKKDGALARVELERHSATRTDFRTASHPHLRR